MPLIKTSKKVKNLFKRLRYFVSYRDGSVAYVGHTQDMRAIAISTATANILVPIRASYSSYVAFPGSTLGNGSNATFYAGRSVFIGCPKDTIQAGSYGWFQTNGTATFYFASGATVVAGYGYQMITGGKTVMMTALAAAASGYPYQIAVAAEAPDGAAATYTTGFLSENPKNCLLTT